MRPCEKPAKPIFSPGSLPTASLVCGRAFGRVAASRADMVQSVGELAERLSSPPGAKLIHFSQLFAPLEPLRDAIVATPPTVPTNTVAEGAGKPPVTSLQH